MRGVVDGVDQARIQAGDACDDMGGAAFCLGGDAAAAELAALRIKRDAFDLGAAQVDADPHPASPDRRCRAM